MVYVIVAVIAAILIFMLYKNSIPQPKTSVCAFTGTMGSGKTFSAVHMLKREYRRRKLVYAFRRILSKLTRGKIAAGEPPTVYSNIPLRVGRRTYARPVTKELLCCEDYFPEGALVLLDEISVVADQYDFDDPLVMERVGRLMKFYRHWTGGKIYVTEQAVSCVTKPIRDKMGTVYQCDGLTRVLFCTPFVKVSVRPLLMIDAEVSTASDEVARDDVPYMVFFNLPFSKFSKKKAYDSRCYKPIYHEGATRSPDFGEDATNMKTRYLCEVCSDNERRKAYKGSRMAEKEWIYKDDRKSD